MNDEWKDKADRIWEILERVAQGQEQLKKDHERFREEQKKTDEQMKKTDEKLQRLCEQIGGISNNNGEATEQFFWNALKNQEKFEGISIDSSSRNIYQKKGKTEDEFDILLWNGNSVVIVEIKHKLHFKDVKKIIERKIPNFRRLFPAKSEQKIYVALAAFIIPEKVEAEAKENGFFVLKQSGENLLVEKDQVKSY